MVWLDASGLFAALNTATGEALGKTARRHTRAQFVAFLADIVSTRPEVQQFRVICDNVGSHKAQAVRALLTERANVTMNYMPTYSPRLNQVEKSTTGSIPSEPALDAQARRVSRQHDLMHQRGSRSPAVLRQGAPP